MDCRDALLLITPHLDGALPKDAETALAEHMAVCEECAGELALQERFSAALRKLGREEVQAPPELCGLVIGRLQAERRSAFRRIPIPATWRKAIAAAAAMLLIAGGSAGVTVGLKIPGGGKAINVATTAPDVNPATGSDVSTPGKNPGDGAANPEGTVQPPGTVGTPGDTGKGSVPESAQANNAGGMQATVNNTSGNEAAVPGVTPPSSEGPRVLLSSGMKVTSTILKLDVDDLPGVRAKAVALAAGAGAETQVFPEQSGGKKIVVIRLTTTSGQATGLITELETLGALVDRQDESNDITSAYNEAMIQYQDLKSRAGSARDDGERQQLEAQAASSKQLLDTWGAEAGKRVITLWLENR